MAEHWRLTMTDSKGEAWTDDHGVLVRVIIDGREMVRRSARGRQRGAGALRSITDLERIGVVVQPWETRHD